MAGTDRHICKVVEDANHLICVHVYMCLPMYRVLYRKCYRCIYFVDDMPQNEGFFIAYFMNRPVTLTPSMLNMGS